MKISSTARRKSGVLCHLLTAGVHSLVDQNLANPHRLPLTQAPLSSMGDTHSHSLYPNKHWSVGYSGLGKLFAAPTSTAVSLFWLPGQKSIPVPHTQQSRWTHAMLSSSAVKDLSCLGFPQKQALGQDSRESGLFRLSQKTLARSGKPRSTRQWCVTQIPSCRQVGCIPAVLSSGPSLEIFGWRQLPLLRSGFLLGTAHTH